MTRRILRAISVKQPFADLIVRGIKDVENRAAPVGYRGPLLIHASRNVNRSAMKRYGYDGRDVPTGAVVGAVELADCTEERGSEWHLRGQTGWYMRDARRLWKPIPFKGNVGLLKVPASRIGEALVRSRRPRPGEVLEIFSFGYFGWGSATRQLIAVADAVESARGFGPPVFVDVRLRRAVRAEGFRDRSFENLLGLERYRWMRTLGNLSIRSGECTIRIAAPEAAEQLLDLALDKRGEGRRIIFFCACETPRRCHRHVVARLVLRAAQRRQVTARIAEWPGGPAPTKVALELRASPTVYYGILGKQVWLPLPKPMALAEVGAIPFGSVARLNARGRRPALVTLGKVRPMHGRWCAEALVAEDEGEGWTVVDAARSGRRDRLVLGHGALA